jgi:hypothetical protein
MSPEFWAAIAGALVGALAAGGLTWALQWQQDRRQTRDRNRALARSLIFKLMRIFSDFRGFKKHVEECSANAKIALLPDGWESLRAIGNLPTSVHFTSDEMSYLLSLKNFSLFNKVLSLDAVHSSTIGIFELYAARRMALTDMLPASMQGAVGTATMNSAALAVVAPRAAELELLAQDIKTRVFEDFNEAREALLETNSAIGSTLGKPMKMELLD